MDEQQPQENFDENGVADVSFSQSSGIDMNYGEMSTSSQNNTEECDVQHSCGIKVLQKALDKLKDKISEFNIPKNEADWQQLFESTLFKSKKHSLSYEEHLWTWLQLIITAEHYKKPEFQQTLLTCYDNAISTLPIKIFECDTTWVVLLNGLYSHILAGEIDASAASPVLETAKRKFKYSPKHARVYWNAVMKNEKQLMKKKEIPLFDEKLKITELLKERYSYPYLHMEDDYNEFARWSLDVNLDKDLRVEVQQTFLKHSKLKKMDYVTQLLEKNNSEDTVDLKHHQLFEEFIEEICYEETPNVDNIEIVCEEMIAEEPESVCYYWVYLNALALPSFEGVIKREERIYDIIVRSFRMGKTACDGVEPRFLEQSLVIASKTLNPAKVLELMEAAMNLFTLTGNITKWHASSRGVLIAISNMIHARVIDAGCFGYFSKVIAPCTMEYFKCSTVPPELAATTGFETQLIDLCRLWVATQESFHNLTWQDVLQLWTNIFMENENPIMLVGYVDFVKNRGSTKDALEATNFALGQMESTESSELPSKRTTRRCYIKLMQDHLDILSAVGETDLQINAARYLQRKLTSYMNQYSDEFSDLTTPVVLIRGFSPYESGWNSSSSSEKMSQESTITFDTSSSECSIVSQLKSLKVAPEAQPEFVPRQNGGNVKVYKAFVANLNFQATEDDLLNAFKDRGFYPLWVEIRRNPQGKSRGFAHVEFDSQEALDLAVKLCDRFEVCDRVTFVSHHRDAPKFPVRKPIHHQPTLLTLTNVPAKWKDEDKINNKLSCYGHVKSVVIEEHDDDSTFSAKIQFHMTEDAQNAYDRIVEKRVFGETTVCRMGYVPNKRLLAEKKVLQKKQKQSSEEKIEFAEKNVETTQPSLGNAAENKPQHIGPQMPPGMAKEKPKLKRKVVKSFNPIPTQVLKQDLPRMSKRSHMRARLDIGASTTEGSSASSNDSPEKKLMRLSTEIRPDISSETDEPELETSSSTSSNDSPVKKVFKDSSDKDIKQSRSAIDRCNSSNGDESNAEELELATNSSMEEEDVSETKPSLTNEDFQRLYKRDS